MGCPRGEKGILRGFPGSEEAKKSGVGEQQRRTPPTRRNECASKGLSQPVLVEVAKKGKQKSKGGVDVKVFFKGRREKRALKQ